MIPEDLPLVEFDAALMERVLVNLLENAAKYGTPAAAGHPDAIVVSATTRLDALELKVRDFGPGLPITVKGKEIDLFEKFTRGESESSKRGVGLGLAICKAIVEAHRGKISGAQALGGGAEFTVTLPRTAPPEPPAPEPA
jgi:two-component system sensor histidine kinase KdpD